MCGEGVAESVGGNVFIDVGAAGGFLDRFLYNRFVDMMTADNACAFVCGYFRRRKKILPYPVFICVFIFTFQGIRQVYRTVTIGEIFFVKGFYVS